MSKIPSPCIDVCKFKRKDHCIRCSMTKKQKSRFKKLDKKKDKLAFYEALLEQQEELGGYGHSTIAAARKAASLRSPK